MSTIEAKPAVQIAFPKQDTGSTALAIPTQPQTPANAQLATVATKIESRKTLICKNLLLGSTLQQAEDEGKKLYEQMKANPQVFMTYGSSALEGVNDLIDRILHEIEPTKIPELTDLMRGLNKEMRGIKHKYDISDPDVQKRYEGLRFKIGRFIGRTHTMLEMLMEDVSSIEKNLDRVAKTLEGKQDQMIRNVSYYDELYEENEKEIGKLIYTIAVMEIIVQLAAEEAAAIKKDMEATPGDAALGDRRGELQVKTAEFANLMEVKVAEYKGRLFVAWATSPQVRMMRTLNVGLAQKLNEMVCVVIPTMKATIAEWRLLMQSQDAAAMTKSVQQASNEWLQSYYKGAAAAVPMIAEAIQYPTLTPETVGVMADSIAAQAEGIIKAIDTGAQLRQELDDSMVEAHKVLEDSSTKVSDAIVDRIVKKANDSLEIAQTVSAT